jgi:hypothetical protein
MFRSLNRPNGLIRCIVMICILTSTDGFLSDLFPWGFPTKVLYAFLISRINTTCPVHLILLDVIILIIQGYSKRSIQFQKFILQKLLTLNPCPVYGWKGNLSKFWYRWFEAAHHWGCGCCFLWHAVTSVGRAGLSIWNLPRHTWGWHRVIVRCENNVESYPFSQKIARRHMLNSKKIIKTDGRKNVCRNL